MGRDGRSKSRSRKGSSNQQRGNNSGSKSTASTPEMKFSITTKANDQRHATFDAVKKYLVAQLRKSPNKLDVADAIENMEPVDMSALEPTLQRSEIKYILEATDGTQTIDLKKQAEFEAEQDGFNRKYDPEWKNHLERVKNYNNNMKALAAQILEDYTTPYLKSKLENLSDFDTLKLDPIATLEKIRALSKDGTHTNTTYRMQTLLINLINFCDLKMFEEEKPDAWTKRVKEMGDNLEQLIGEYWLRTFIEDDKEYTDLRTKYRGDAGKLKEAQDTYCKNQWEALKAFKIIHHACAPKYAGAKSSLLRDLGLGMSTMPTHPTAAMDYLNLHVWDDTHKQVQQTRKEQERQKRESKRAREDEIQLAQRDGPKVCYCCGQPNHVATRKHCPILQRNPNYPKHKWAVNQTRDSAWGDYCRQVTSGTQHAQQEQSVQADQVDRDESPDRRSECANRSHTPAPTSRGRSSRRSDRRGALQNTQVQITQIKDGMLEFCFTQGSKTNKAWIHLKDPWLLDSASTCHTFMNSDHVKDIRRAKHPLQISTNAGQTRMDLIATVDDFIEPHFDTSGVANIVSAGLLIQSGFRVVMDSDVGHWFDVYQPGCKDFIRFSVTKEGLFAYEPSQKWLDEVALSKGFAPHEKKTRVVTFDDDTASAGSMTDSAGSFDQFEFEGFDAPVDDIGSPEDGDSVTTIESPENNNLQEFGFDDDVDYQCLNFTGLEVDNVKANLAHYTPQVISNAKRARRLQIALGCTVEKLKGIITHNLIKNNPVTCKHVDLAEQIFGPDVSHLKGKTTRKQPGAVIDDQIVVPPQIHAKNPVLILGIDIMCVNKIPVLTGRDYSVKHRFSEDIADRTVPSIRAAVKRVLRKYNRGNFMIGRIDADNEFKPLLNTMPGVAWNFAPPGAHVAVGERNIRTIKEGTRSRFHGLPYRYFPTVMLTEGVHASVQALNLLPAKGGVSETLGPYSIITGRPVDYNRLVKYTFGEYVQAEVWTEPRNSQKPRTLDCIYLRPGDSLQEGHILMHVQTGKRVTSRVLYPVHLTPSIIKAVNRIGKRQSKIRGFKIESRDNIPIIPAEWQAGVDYDEDLLSDSESESDSSDSDYEDEMPDMIHHDPDDSDSSSSSSESDSDSESDSESDDEPIKRRRRWRIARRKTKRADINDFDAPPDDEPDVEEKEVEAEVTEDTGDDDQPEPEEPEPEEPDEPQAEEETIEFEEDDNPHRPNVMEDPGVWEEESNIGRPRRENAGKWTSTKFHDEQAQHAQKTGVAIAIPGVGGKAKTKAKARTPKHQSKRKRSLEQKHLLCAQAPQNPDDDWEYEPEMAPVIAAVMIDINARASAEGSEFVLNHVHAGDQASFAQQYLLGKGLQKFGQRGADACTKELDQLHRRTAFSPVAVEDLTPEEKRRAVQALLFLTEKRDGSVKGRMVYNGKPTRDYFTKEDTASPTASQEGIILCGVIDAKEGRDSMIADIPNAFIQAVMPTVGIKGKRVIMKITGRLVDLLVQLAPEVYSSCVVEENGQRVIYVEVEKGLYGMLIAALLWYTKFRKDLEGIGFEANPYDPCVFNRMVKGKQHTVRFHVDDLWSSHVDPDVNTKFHKWLNKMYGEYGEVQVTRAKKFDYLGVDYDLSEPGILKADMSKYVTKMVNDFPYEMGTEDPEPHASDSDLFEDSQGEDLPNDKAETFHTFVAKGIFACKRARPDIHHVIAVLCTRVKRPKDSDWKHLLHLMRFLRTTKDDALILSADSLHILKFYADSSFAVHPDYRSHTGGGLTLGRGFPLTLSRKQRLNTRCSTSSELVGADDIVQLMLWTLYFMEAQGYKIEENILYQDNKSTILLLENGKKSSSQRTRAINIRYFFLTDQISKGNVTVKYCPTDLMWADYLTKPLQGSKAIGMREQLMGHR